MNNQSSSQCIAWPASLKDIFAAHMQNIEQLETPTFPPFGDGKRSSFNVLRDIFDVLSIKHFTSPEEREYNEMMFQFLIQLMEDCCHRSFLKPKEREKLKAHFSRRHGHPGHVRKRKDEESGAAVEAEKPHFSLQLPAEYLLRFLAALPLLVDTYLNFCGGNGMDKSLLGELWKRVEVVLVELEGSGVFYSPLLEYQP